MVFRTKVREDVASSKVNKLIVEPVNGPTNIEQERAVVVPTATSMENICIVHRFSDIVKTQENDMRLAKKFFAALEQYSVFTTYISK